MFMYCIRNVKTGDVIRGFGTEQEAFNQVVQLEMDDLADGQFELDTYLIYKEEVQYV